MINTIYVVEKEHVSYYIDYNDDAAAPTPYAVSKDEQVLASRRTLSEALLVLFVEAGPGTYVKKGV